MSYFTKYNAVDKVCLQGHFHGPMPITEVYQRLERFAEFGLPMMITEFDFFEIDAELKAKFTEDLITLFYSYPLMDGFMHWNLTDLYNDDGSLNESGVVVDKLLHKTWHTSVAKPLNADGKLSFNGFKGKYQVTVTTADGANKVYNFDTENNASHKIVVN